MRVKWAANGSPGGGQPFSPCLATTDQMFKNTKQTFL